jgi:glycosyltransferase involved in cell wall biosynthesis
VRDPLVRPEPPEGMQLRARILVPGDPGQMTGGYLYDAWVAAGLSARGHDVAVLDLHAPETDEALAVFGTVVVVDELAHREYLARARRKPREFLALVHHLSSWEPAEQHPRSWLVGAREEAFLRRASAVITTSARSGERLFRYAPTVLPPVADVGAVPKGRAGFCAECTFVSVGTITARKQLLPLVRAARAELGPTDRFLIIGEDRYEPAYAKAVYAEAAGDPRIVFLGVLPREELLTHVANADALFLVSSFEGYGMAAAEALALGTPIVVTAVVAEALGAAVRPGENAIVIDGVDRLGDVLSELRSRPLVFARPPALPQAGAVLDGWERVLQRASGKKRART